MVNDLLQFILELFAYLDSTSADVRTQFELSILSPSEFSQYIYKAFFFLLAFIRSSKRTKLF